MKSFVTYLKSESPAMELASGPTGWIELPNGQRWNPAHTYKFNGSLPRRSWLQRFFRLLGGRKNAN
mgnify:CR=1 FL=1